MKKSVHSWEFWAVVAVSMLLLYALYEVLSALSSAGQSASQLVSEAEQVPGQVAGAAGTLAGNVVGFFESVFGLGNSSPQSNTQDGATDL